MRNIRNRITNYSIQISAWSYNTTTEDGSILKFGNPVKFLKNLEFLKKISVKSNRGEFSYWKINRELNFVGHWKTIKMDQNLSDFHHSPRGYVTIDYQVRINEVSALKRLELTRIYERKCISRHIITNGTTVPPSPSPHWDFESDFRVEPIWYKRSQKTPFEPEWLVCSPR